jgi:UDP-N-acetyl-D-galactosamine dehydrogenase
VYAPLVTKQLAMEYTGVDLATLQDLHDLGAVIIAVPHRQFTEFSAQYFIDTQKSGGCIIDVKSMFDTEGMKSKDRNLLVTISR